MPHAFGNLRGVGGIFLWTDYEHQSADLLSIYAPPVNTSLVGSDSYQDTRFPTQSYAVFLNESYHFTPEFALTLGGRYTQEHKVLDTYNTSFNWTGGLPAGWAGYNPANPGVRGTMKTTTLVYYPGTTTINQYSTAYYPFVLGYGNNFPGSPPDAVQNVSAFTPKAGIEWQATKDAFLFASVTRGFKSGGFNFTARNPVGLTFLPEWITTYEVGAKTDWFDRRLRVNVSVFRNDWTNLQVNQSISIPGVTTPFQQASNAANARLTGFDADITAKPWDGWTFTSSVTWLPDAQYVNFTTGQVNGSFLKNLIISRNDPRENATLGTYNANGKRLMNAPDISAIITAQKDFELGAATAFLSGARRITPATLISTFRTTRSRAATLSPWSMGRSAIAPPAATTNSNCGLEIWRTSNTSTT